MLVIGPELTAESLCHVACLAAFAEATMNQESGIGSDLATEPPRHVACLAVFPGGCLELRVRCRFRPSH